MTTAAQFPPEEKPTPSLLEMLADDDLRVDQEAEAQLSKEDKKILWRYRYECLDHFLTTHIAPNHFHLEPGKHNVKNLPPEHTFLFVPPLRRFSALVQQLVTDVFTQKGYEKVSKFVNPMEPAINLKFATKHLYYCKKKPSLDEVRDFFVTLAITKKDITAEEVDYFKFLVQHHGEYEFCISNYYKYYTYYVVNYRYVDENGEIQYSQKHASGLRRNVVFIVPDMIATQFSNMNKTIESYLAGFNEQIVGGTNTLYLRPRAK